MYMLVIVRMYMYVCVYMHVQGMHRFLVIRLLYISLQLTLGLIFGLNNTVVYC